MSYVISERESGRARAIEECTTQIAERRSKCSNETTTLHLTQFEPLNSYIVQGKHDNAKRSLTIIEKYECSLNGVDTDEEKMKRSAIANRSAKGLKQDAPEIVR